MEDKLDDNVYFDLECLIDGITTTIRARCDEYETAQAEKTALTLIGESE